VRTGYRPGWSLPGGHVGRGESLERALEREVREETGYRVAAERLLVVDAREPGTLVFVFAARVLDGQPDLAPLEIRALDWVDDDAIAGLLELDRSRLRQALEAAEDGAVRYLTAPTDESQVP